MGTRTNSINVSISAIAPECSAVQQITAVTDTFHTIQISWTPVETDEYNSVSYLIFRDNSTFASDTTDETSITYDGLPAGEHCFIVRALSSGEYNCLSEASDTVCAEIRDIPCNVSLSVGAENDGESIFISWNKPAGVEYFRIYRDDNAVEEVLTENRYTDSNVVPETEYCYTIVAYFENEICNEIVATACTRIVSGLCAEAPFLKVETVGNSVILNWTGDGDSSSYKIFRDGIPLGLSTDTTYYDNVAQGLTYCYKVEKICQYGMFIYSNEECVSIEYNDGENAVDTWTEDNLSVYPNPTFGHFFIEGPQIGTVLIYNAAGLLIQEINSNEYERIVVNCETWNPGLYNILIISEDGKTATRRISIFR